MSRPRFSSAGFRRRIQMSTAQLFAFVEGRSDRYVYGKLLDETCGGVGIRFFIFTAEEVAESGGKRALLGLFDYLRKKDSLIDRSFGTASKVSMFFLDKDVDDYRRTKKRSRHVVYTELYEIENYYFVYGDLAEAAAAAAGLDTSTVRAALPSYEDWRRRAARHWRKWVLLCLYARTRTPRGQISRFYNRPVSPLHEAAYAECDEHRYQEYVEQLRAASFLDGPGFAQSMRRLEIKLARLYEEGAHDRVFKGKWYIPFLVEDVRRIASDRSVKTSGLHDRLTTALCQSLDFQADWTRHFVGPARAALKEAGLIPSCSE